MDRLDYVINIIEDWDESSLIEAWNAECDTVGESLKVIYRIVDEFDEVFGDLLPLDIVYALEGGNFSTKDDYFITDDDGNIQSFSSLKDCPCFNTRQIAEYLVDYGDAETADVDRDRLMEGFIKEYGKKYPEGFDIAKGLSDLEDEWLFDLLTDSWDEIDEDLRKLKKIK